MTLILSAVIFIAIFAGMYTLFILPTQWLKTEKIRLDLGIGKKILQLSDLHVERLRVRPGQIRRVIEAERPDYIIITGDFTKLPSSLPKLGTYLSMVRDSGIPAYAVLGNHDHQQPKVSRLIKFIEGYGIRILRNEAALLDGFQLVGIDDFDSGKSRIRKSFAHVQPQLPILVATHDPNIVLMMKQWSYHYLMAGHLHGKQINIPFFYKFRPMGPLPASGIYKGLHRKPYGTFYISKGLGQTGINIRFMVRSEVTLHML